jgi:hypothetical protein
MNNTPGDDTSSRNAKATPSAEVSASYSEDGTNPIWLMVGASALFFVIAAALLASG